MQCDNCLLNDLTKHYCVMRKRKGLCSVREIRCSTTQTREPSECQDSICRWFYRFYIHSRLAAAFSGDWNVEFFNERKQTVTSCFIRAASRARSRKNPIADSKRVADEEGRVHRVDNVANLGSNWCSVCMRTVKDVFARLWWRQFTVIIDSTRCRARHHQVIKINLCNLWNKIQYCSKSSPWGEVTKQLTNKEIMRSLGEQVSSHESTQRHFWWISRPQPQKKTKTRYGKLWTRLTESDCRGVLGLSW